MGCDIHMVVERRWKREGQGDVWVGVHAMPYFSGVIYGAASWRTWDGDTPTDHVQHQACATGYVHWEARHRNYALFYALAQVRGPAEAASGTEPRGVPDDASDLARMEIEGWGEDGHSHSYMLFSEAMPIFLKHQFGGRLLDTMKQRIAGAKPEELYAQLASEHFGVDLREPWDGEPGETLDDYRLVFWFDN